MPKDQSVAPPAPLSSNRVCPPPLEPGGGGDTLLASEGAGEANSDDWRESLALCILCANGGCLANRYCTVTVLMVSFRQHSKKNSEPMLSN
jgi:hypothetical protein